MRSTTTQLGLGTAGSRARIRRLCFLPSSVQRHLLTPFSWILYLLTSDKNMVSSSRRKSCLACARGKRRCDLGFPQCGRCLARRVTCSYPWISPQEAQEMVQSVRPGTWVPQEARHSSLDRCDQAETYQWNHCLAGPGEGHATDAAIPGALTTTPVTVAPALVPLLDELIGRGRTVSFIAPDLQLDSPTKSHCQTVGSVSCASQPLQNSGISTTPLQIASKSSIITGRFLQARVEYCASRLVRQVTTLVETGQTAFIHHSQVDASPILRDAFAACSLYSVQNSVNTTFVRSEIARRAQLLVEATETAMSAVSSSPHSAMELDLLPAVQAMLVYQCMRRFSTVDIEQQAQAELDAKSLAKWVDILQKQTQWSSCNINSDGGSELDHSVWKDWVRAESIRRTVIFSELIDSIYTFLRFGWYQASERIAKLCFTGQVALWEARSAEEWYQARWQRLWFEVNVSSLHVDMKAALPEDLDELGMIIWVSYDGIEALKEWLSHDVRLLEKWGLSPRDSYISSWF